MATFLDTIKAIITRLVFACHGLIGIWQVTIFKKNVFFWYLSSPLLLLFFEGIFTLTIKENQEWKCIRKQSFDIETFKAWKVLLFDYGSGANGFCPSVFLYLASIVPSIWLIELNKVDKKVRTLEDILNLTTNTENQLKQLNRFIGVQIELPEINLSAETWITLIEQFLMLILIIGRWMLPKGDLTRDQLSQILLVYIGTAADIIEFFDSCKDDKVASEQMLVILTLSIWSWSLMQFTVVLTATKSRKSRMSSTEASKRIKSRCCNIDIWGIALNIVLQDAPFLAFRLLMIVHYRVISYMNVFFTCKNTLVIVLQVYRLHVVHSETKRLVNTKDFELTSISIISKSDMSNYQTSKKPERTRSRREKLWKNTNGHYVDRASGKSKPSRKDTGYSTESSHNSNKQKLRREPKTKGKGKDESLWRTEKTSEASYSDSSRSSDKNNIKTSKSRQKQKSPSSSSSTE